MNKLSLEPVSLMSSSKDRRGTGPSKDETHLILASASPRRRALLALAGWPFALRSIDVDETPGRREEALAVTQRLARAKAEAAHKGLPATAVVLAADTIVADDQGVLGKPADREQARNMLRRLRGRRHTVVTSLAVIGPDGSVVLEDVCTTEVRMRDYTDAEIGHFVASGEAYDKAGAYAIQDAGFNPVDVEALHGCFANVMGLPMCHVVRALRRRGLEPSQDVPTACRAHTGYDCPVFDQILRGEA